jgi:hypothetical protein
MDPARRQECTWHYHEFPEDEHDHGGVFLIGNTDEHGCYDIPLNRYVVIFASYNAVEETKKLHDFLKEQCAGVGGGPCRPAPDGLRIHWNDDSGCESESARRLDRCHRRFSGW